MITRVWSVIQAAVEYGAVTSGKASQAMGVEKVGPARVGAWAADNQMVLMVGAAGLLLFVLARSAYKR